MLLGGSLLFCEIYIPDAFDWLHFLCCLFELIEGYLFTPLLYFALILDLLNRVVRPQ